MSRLTNAAALFANAIVDGDANTAHAMLVPKLASEVSASALAREFELLADDMGGVTNVGEPMLILEDWPARASNELGVLYVPLEGDVYSEAITITVCESDSELKISNIEWGRP